MRRCLCLKRACVCTRIGWSADGTSSRAYCRLDCISQSSFDSIIGVEEASGASRNRFQDLNYAFSNFNDQGARLRQFSIITSEENESTRLDPWTLAYATHTPSLCTECVVQCQHDSVSWLTQKKTRSSPRSSTRRQSPVRLLLNAPPPRPSALSISRHVTLPTFSQTTIPSSQPQLRLVPQLNHRQGPPILAKTFRVSGCKHYTIISTNQSGALPCCNMNVNFE